ncbi:MAG: DUF192 domain-containing protein [Nanoarchaeota archaeon]
MYIKIGRREFASEFCRGLSLFLGFMFHFQGTIVKVLVFREEQKVSLHMLFVFFPLKAIFLNAKKEIVEVAILRPFTFYTSEKMAKYVVELPYSLSKGLEIKVGDKIKFIN